MGKPRIDIYNSLIEKSLKASGYIAIGGVDEAGRGALAGPVVAACVITGNGFDVDGVNDSKKLTPEKRESLYDEIIAKAISVGVAFVGPREIDEINILQASLEAMRQAVRRCDPSPDVLIVDGNQGFKATVPLHTVIKGDSQCLAIAAASIIAKVTRDRYMTELAGEFPDYGFDLHKGYGTEIHIRAIRELGPTSHHRMSFAPLQDLLRPKLFDNEVWL